MILNTVVRAAKNSAFSYSCITGIIWIEEKKRITKEIFQALFNHVYLHIVECQYKKPLFGLCPILPVVGEDRSVWLPGGWSGDTQELERGARSSSSAKISDWDLLDWESGVDSVIHCPETGQKHDVCKYKRNSV